MEHTLPKPVILIVDDAAESIDVLRGVLGKDYQVKVAINGPTALELADSACPDLILLDVMMPGMDGYEVCQRLKATPSTNNIPVIFVTTLADAENEAHGLELGAVDYIAKPYVPSLVRSRVRTHLALHRQNVMLQCLVERATAELSDTRLEIIRRLGRAAEYRDNETGMHVLRMSHLSRKLALEVGLSEARAELILQSSPMHDIGKIGVPDSILLKPGKLDAAEWELMKRHTTVGAEIIGDHPSELMVMARMVALRHHERWDGSGYPGGLSGLDIPEVARIVALADVFDALLSVRPYKPAWSVQTTLEHIRAESGRHFEPRLVEALLRILPTCLAIREQFSD
ncbi:MAG TPA: two-component system response regulator [Polyangiaceae bacterium]|nr:two-component system response regulator [Polyangiaceae bacterium]